MERLIVDDSVIILNRIARVLSDPRLNSIQMIGMARNGVEAIALFVQHLPELVTMDLTMPEMDGIDCTEKMIALRPTATSSSFPR
jgi:two-component system chemotaxis response regulator CheY